MTGGDDILVAKIKQRLDDAQRHLAALEEAAAQFGGDFDAGAFEAAWNSPDPAELRRAYEVQAGFENAVNACVKTAQDLCRLERWWTEPTVPSAPEALKLLQENGVITANTRGKLKDAQEARSDVQHDYVDVAPQTIHDLVPDVLDQAPLLLQGVADQLRQH